MQKYEILWQYIAAQTAVQIRLSFDTIEKIAGVPIDHSFLQYKKELKQYGWQVEKISIKNQTVQFCRIGAVVTVRRLLQSELPAALELCWTVFCQFEAPEYTQEGIREFQAALQDGERNRQMEFYGAFDENTLVGVLAVRAPQHIGYFFVKPEYHRRGIGRKLFETMRETYEIPIFTVNSSPYAVEFYRRLGFAPTDGEQVTNGIRYTPMRYEAEKQ
ncbi:MAG: GNAT family N-acetyltransferase [Candidatus Fimenecus sp.]